MPDRALYDERSKATYGVKQPKGESLKLADGAVDLLGGFHLGTDFGKDGNLIVSESTYVELFPQRASGDEGLDDVDLGMIKVKPGVDPAAVQVQLTRILPEDVTVFTKTEFENQ